MWDKILTTNFTKPELALVEEVINKGLVTPTPFFY